MKNKIGIFDYGVAGNIESIRRALEKAGAEVVIISCADDFVKSNKLIIPGVGSFADAMNRIKESGLLHLLLKEIKQKPTLGICLGMQILSTIGFENGSTEGLQLIESEVKLLSVKAKVPHLGFNKISVIKPNKLLQGLENEEFYFMHSYEMTNCPDVAAVTNYAGHKIICAINKDNIFGVQFHPEKSREAGIKLFKNFIEL